MRADAGRAFVLVMAAALLLGACRRSRTGETANTEPPPLAGDWLVSLSVPGFEPAKVALPLGARRARPLVIALHGDDARPEWTCGSYHHAARSAFVLCPSGPRRPDGRFGLGPLDATRTELRASLPKLKSRYANHLAKGAVVLAALGPSVEQAIALALEEPAFFSRLVLVDGPFSRWSAGAAERFRSAGGVRVLFVCTASAPCETDAAEHALRLKRAGVDARHTSTSQGRGLDRDATELLAREWAWLVAGDTRWK